MGGMNSLLTGEHCGYGPCSGHTHTPTPTPTFTHPGKHHGYPPPSHTTAPPASPTVSPSATVSVSPSGHPASLPVTGSNIPLLLGVAVIALVLGVGLYLRGRRTRTS